MNWRCRREQNPFLFFLGFFGLRVSYPSAHALTSLFPRSLLPRDPPPSSCTRTSFIPLFWEFFPRFFHRPRRWCYIFAPSRRTGGRGWSDSIGLPGCVVRGDGMGMKKIQDYTRDLILRYYYCNTILS